MLKVVIDRVVSLAVAVTAILLAGTVGYALVEGWDWFDGLYMTVITFSTVGYGETHDLSQPGRIFTSFLILFSVITMVYISAGITSLFISADISGSIQKRNTMKSISRMRKHTVVCGGGGVIARTVIDGLLKDAMPVVAIIEDPEELLLIQRLYPDLLVVPGDPKNELALSDANLLKAKHLVAATESDYDNLLITITGKGIGIPVEVFSCATSTELASRMYKVGADKVICPMVIGGEHLKALISEAA